MVKKKDEIIELVTQRIGEDTSDEALALLEDITDTLNNYETMTADNTNWKTRYEENDKEWRTKYKERFMSGDNSHDEELVEDEPERKYTFDSLFKEG